MLGFSSAKLCLIAAAVVLASAATSAAEPFPSKMVRIIVPYAPGGSIDLVARVLAKNIQDSVGQTVIVENKPGAGGALGMDALVRSPADGHTVAIVSDSPITINPHLAKLNYDPLVDLVPVTKVVSSPILLGVNPKAGINSIADLVAASKAKAGGLSYAVSYRGSTSYLAGELLQRELGIKMQAVPYRGGAPATVAIVAGEVPLGLVDTAAILPMVRSGEVRALGIADPVRSPTMPDIPTLAEAGVPNFSATSWLAVFAPRGTPPEAVAKLSAEIAKVLDVPDARKTLLAAGLEPAHSGPDDMFRLVRDGYAKWGNLIQAIGFKPE
jgi:tripartite-type tricarboxylate transporter receptor subunit TctC